VENAENNNNYLIDAVIPRVIEEKEVKVQVVRYANCSPNKPKKNPTRAQCKPAPFFRKNEEGEVAVAHKPTRPHL